jgi:hypothetical protein
MPLDDQRTFGELLRQFAAEARTLARLDLLLLKTETREKVGTLVSVAGLSLFGIVFLIFAVSYFLQAADRALVERGFSPEIAGLIMGGALVVIALALLWSAAHRLRTWSVVPSRTIAQVNTNLSALKASMENGSATPTVAE